MSSSNENDFMVGGLWSSQYEELNVLNGPSIRKVENLSGLVHSFCLFGLSFLRYFIM